MSASASDERGPEGAPCVLCARVAATDSLVAETEYSAAFADEFPLSEGHSLVVPRRHETDLMALPDEERSDLWALADALAATLRRELEAAGINVGANIGASAGQTVAHAHIHLIPRYEGDVADPRGGVRWVLPHRAAYWNE
ncbi:HIT family protein [Thermoleophilia bacterium SCSIO 60948]|nr:HIT family protein [Thermoleophilia bacterium SCSIO 60948]